MNSSYGKTCEKAHLTKHFFTTKNKFENELND